MICQRIPLGRRRLAWARAIYICDLGPKSEDGPFAGEHQGGCGWHRHVYLGVGVGKPVAIGVPAVPPPAIVGECSRCGGPLSLESTAGFLPLPDHVGSGDEVEVKDEPILLVPGRRVAGRMAHQGELYAQLREPAADSIEDPGER